MARECCPKAATRSGNDDMLQQRASEDLCALEGASRNVRRRSVKVNAFPRAAPPAVNRHQIATTVTGNLWPEKRHHALPVWPNCSVQSDLHARLGLCSSHA